MSILGLHHITAVTQNARRQVDFYTGLLGFRLIKQTVNYDEPESYHIYFGDDSVAGSSLITFFEWPQAARGKRGIGSTHHLALRVPHVDALLRWKRRLTDADVRVRGPYPRTYFTSIYFEDPDGLIIEIATDGPGLTVDEAADKLGQQEVLPAPEYTRGVRDESAIEARTWPEPVPHITPDMNLGRSFHHLSAVSSDIARVDWFLREVLGLPLVKQTVNYDDPTSKHWYWGLPDGALITYFERSPKNTRQAQMGVGLTHHYALAVADEAALSAWHDKLIAAGITVSEVRDRIYYKSIDFHDPDGHRVEIATLSPGLTVDEPQESLGAALMLPPALESARPQFEASVINAIVPPSRGGKD